MEKKKFRKKGGRPRLPEYEKRINVTVMLTPTEIKQLRSECQDYVDVFGVFLREKLLATKTVRLLMAVDPAVRSEMTNLLKFSGALTMIAKRLEYNALLSQDFIDMSANLKKIVRHARYNINEVVVSEAVVPKVTRSLSKLMHAISSHQATTVTLKDVSRWHVYLSEIVAELEVFCASQGLDID
ncbi:hypothetical protein FEM33_25240 [Dyadobacter flavalbus]|uniref:Uncharacterized protein n=1 Tax=Dyadobacter flavalbus TaxID=2579942 RepID=A0A5M8Q931_9BACT|nr:hypothetical protein [Dyadobacter flavalbus]KAA6431611.1 hypothetical protein FEM33_25240 [Dyadobacter flavalbus]